MSRTESEAKLEAELRQAFRNFFNRDIGEYHSFFTERDDRILSLAYSYLFWIKLRAKKNCSEETEKLCTLYGNEIRAMMIEEGLGEKVFKKVNDLLRMEAEDLEDKGKKEALQEMKRSFNERTKETTIAFTVMVVSTGKTLEEYVEISASKMIMWNLIRENIADSILKLEICDELCQMLTEQFRIRNIESEVKRAMYYTINDDQDIDMSKSYEEIFQILCMTMGTK